MAKVEAASIPQSPSGKRELYATVCYYYHQYRLKEVADMPFRDVQLLVRTAQKLEAMKFYNMTQIAAAPHTKKGAGVKKLADHFKKLSRG